MTMTWLLKERARGWRMDQTICASHIKSFSAWRTASKLPYPHPGGTAGREEGGEVPKPILL